MARDVAGVIKQMTERGVYARLGVDPPEVGEIEDMVRRVEALAEELDASLPKPWEEMNNAERDEWFAAHGGRKLTEEEVAQYFGGYGHATVTPLGRRHRPIARGSFVAVEQADGSWQNRMRAVSADGDLVFVAPDEEYQQAEREGREPLTVAYPTGRVKLVGGV